MNDRIIELFTLEKTYSIIQSNPALSLPLSATSSHLLNTLRIVILPLPWAAWSNNWALFQWSFPNTQSKFPLGQPEAISSCSITCHRRGGWTSFRQQLYKAVSCSLSPLFSTLKNAPTSSAAPHRICAPDSTPALLPFSGHTQVLQYPSRSEWPKTQYFRRGLTSANYRGTIISLILPGWSIIHLLYLILTIRIRKLHLQLVFHRNKP